MPIDIIWLLAELHMCISTELMSGKRFMFSLCKMKRASGWTSTHKSPLYTVMTSHQSSHHTNFSSPKASHILGKFHANQHLTN